MHQTFFLIPAPMLLKAIVNNQVTGFPCMNAKDIKRYLAPWPARPKCTTKKPRAGIRTMVKNGERDKEITRDGDMHSDGGIMCSDSVEITNNMSCFCSNGGQGKVNSAHERFRSITSHISSRKIILYYWI